MQNIDHFSITQVVKDSFANCKDERLHTVMTRLVQHLHDFAREVELTEEEWFAAIQFLTDAGHITDDRRQEFILLSDTLGLSMLVVAQNNQRTVGCTEPTILGPFYIEGAPVLENGADIANGANGDPCWVKGTIRGLDGEPVSNAQIDIWHSDEDGLYDVQKTDLDHAQARARLFARDDGSFNFRSILATSYPIPNDGPVGKMLSTVGRHPWRPAHVHFKIEAEGYKRLITHVFNRRSDYLDSDAVFGVRSGLICDWVLHEPGEAPDGTRCDRPFYTLEYDFILQRNDP